MSLQGPATNSLAIRTRIATAVRLHLSMASTMVVVEEVEVRQGAEALLEATTMTGTRRKTKIAGAGTVIALTEVDVTATETETGIVTVIGTLIGIETEMSGIAMVGGTSRLPLHREKTKRRKSEGSFQGQS